MCLTCHWFPLADDAFTNEHPLLPLLRTDWFLAAVLSKHGHGVFHFLHTSSVKHGALNGSPFRMALAQRVDTLKQKGISETHRQGTSSNLITCFVTQPDNIVLRIDIDTKANGQEVLNKVI